MGVLKARRAPTPQHPYGYMRDRFVWSLISAVGIFFLVSALLLLCCVFVMHCVTMCIDCVLIVH